MDPEQVFQKKLEQFTRETFADETKEYSDDEIAAIAHYATEKSYSYGIRNQDDIARYLTLMIIYGFYFDQELDWAKDILTDPRIPFEFGKLRMQVLMEQSLKNIDSEIEAEKRQKSGQ